MELKSYDALTHVNGLEPDELKDLWEGITKEKNIDRALLAISRHAPHMADLRAYMAKIDERVTTADVHSHNITVESLMASRFWDVASGFELAKYKRHVQGLISVKSGRGSAGKKTDKKARTTSPPLSLVPSDAEEESSEPRAASARRPFFTWF